MENGRSVETNGGVKWKLMSQLGIINSFMPNKVQVVWLGDTVIAIQKFT